MPEDTNWTLEQSPMDGDSKTLDPRAKNKFARAGKPGRVMNVEAVTDGSGDAEVLLKHPDGTIELLARVAVPKLSETETCVVRVRIYTHVRDVAEAVEELA